MNNAELAHNWANHYYGRNEGQKSGNMYTCSARQAIYSYGSHYTIARHVDFLKDYDIIMSTGRYSVSTSQHCSHVSHAIASEKRVLYVYSCPYEGESIDHCRHNMLNNIKHEVEEAHDVSKKIPNAKSRRQDYIKEVESLILHAEEIRKTFKIKWVLVKKSMKSDLYKLYRNVLKGDWVDASAKSTKKERERERALKAARERKVREDKKIFEDRAKEVLLEWKEGANVYHGGFRSLPCDLRVKGAYVETSQGAKVPVKHARKLWPIAEACRATSTKKLFKLGTFSMGVFRLDHINENGDVKIGCHNIRFEAMSEIKDEVFAGSKNS